ncbi:unnamed protein product [Caenorhabditis brenneri]
MKLLFLISFLALFTVNLALIDPIISNRETGVKWRPGPFAKNNHKRFPRAIFLPTTPSPWQKRRALTIG